MSWLAVAHRDITDARRSNVLLAAIGSLSAFVALVAATTSESGSAPAEDVLWTTNAIVIWYVPIVSLVIGYLAIAGERETGRIKHLLGLPLRRRDVLLGKLVSRSLVAVVAVAVAMAVGGVIALVRFGSVPIGHLVAQSTFVAGFAVVYVAIAVGISALSATRMRAMVGVVSVYVFFTIAWVMPGINPHDSVAYVVEDLLGLSARPALYDFVYHLSPSFAYSRLTNGFLFERAEDGAMPPEPGDPFYLQEWFMPVILLAWLVVALGVGYARFRRAEIG
ncbi:ABC transporter permease subunit [Halovivax gelatinilyticus]|uniref:ABC transporter permease subunit n=1 Tax=Halovivax gelatinilyticus TaxID=2961597 RepID=UPI0020CA70F2|nr:ABC transporter permease subunit [Halovivax gelatinilyticus]